MLAPVVIFTYNRPEHLKKTIEALKDNHLADQSELIVFSDGPRNKEDEKPIQEIRHFINSLDGFKNIQITAREKNLGLARSIISGVDSVFEKSEKVIVLEDDLITSSDFLNFMNDCLNTFEADDKIFSASGYTPRISIPDDYPEDVYLSYRPNSWGWATWKNRWQSVDWTVGDFDTFIHDNKSISAFNKSGKDVTIMLLKQMTGKINSWAIRFTYACYKKNAYCVYPRISRIKNIGTDGSGTHVRKTRKYDISRKLLDTPYDLNPNVSVNEEIINNFAAFFKPSLIRMGINYFKLKKHLLSR